MELQEYLRTLRRHWRGATVITLLSLLAALVLTLVTQPQYKAETAVFFSVASGESASDLAQGGVYSQQQVTSFAELVATPLVLDPAIRELGLDISPKDLAGQLSASSPTDTSIVRINVSDTDPSRAADIANVVATQLKAATYQLSPKREDGTSMIQATITTQATSPEAPVSPQPKINLILGLVVGLGLGIGYAVLREVLDNKIHTEQDMQALIDVPVLGQIGADPEVNKRHLNVETSSLTAWAESFKKLRVNLQFAGFTNHPRSFCVVSSLPGEGKTSVSINLAITMAQSGASVCLVDADLRKPAVASYLGLEGAIGLTSVLIGDADSADVTQRWGNLSLDVLAAGSRPPNPSDLLSSTAMSELIEELEQRYDVVIVDSPPLSPVSDGFTLARQTQGALLVVGSGTISRDQFMTTWASLMRIDAPVMGIVLNKVKLKDLKDSYYAYEAVDTPRRAARPAPVPAVPRVSTSANMPAKEATMAEPSVASRPVVSKRGPQRADNTVGLKD